MAKKIDLKKMESSIKQEDNILILHEPIVIKKYDRDFKINPILWKDWEEFGYAMGCFMNYYSSICNFSMLPSNLNEVSQFSSNIKTTLVSGKTAAKHFFKMLKLK